LGLSLQKICSPLISRATRHHIVAAELDTCLECSAENLLGSRFCNTCGARLDSDGQFRRREDVQIGRKGNQGAALIGLGILFLFGAYLAYEHQACYQYQQLFGTTYCVQIWYPFRLLGLFVGLVGLMLILVGLAVVGRGD